MFAYGDTEDYSNGRNCIGFVRRGTATHPGCAVILSNKEERLVSSEPIYIQGKLDILE